MLERFRSGVGRVGVAMLSTLTFSAAAAPAAAAASAGLHRESHSATSKQQRKGEGAA